MCAGCRPLLLDGQDSLKTTMAPERQRSTSRPTAFWFNPDCKTKIKIWLRTILILISFVFILPLTAASALYRCFISALSCCLRPDLTNILSLHSSSFIVQNVQVHMCRNVLLRFKMRGQLNFESIKTRFTERFVKAINPSTQQLVRPELQQYPVRWARYDFWKWESGFNIDVHIIHRQNDAVGEVAGGTLTTRTLTNEEMNEIEIQFLKTPFELDKSPWQMVIIDTIEQQQQQNDEPSFLVLFKFHHSLCDGLSLFNALMECADQQVPALEVPSPPRRPFVLELLSWITFPFQAAYTYARFTEQKMATPPWDIQCVDQSATLAKQSHVVRSTHLDKTRVKKLSSDWQVSFTAVLLAAITGGIRNFLLLGDKKLVEVPDFMVVEVQFPVERHAVGLTNDLCVVSFILPIRCADIGQRIAICEQSVAVTKSSIQARMTHIFFDLFALLPDCLLPYKLPAAAVSIFPGPLKSAKFCGQELFEMSYVQLSLPIVFMMTILTYGDGLQFYCSGDSRVFTQDDMQHIVQCIEEEIGNMEDVAVIDGGVNE